MFDWFRKLRNKAAHQPVFHVTKNELSVLKDEKHKDPTQFYDLCIELIGGFWNQHIPIFGSKFAPGASGKENGS